MGVDFDFCNAHWGYAGFNRFREKLAKEIGIDLRKMDGYWEGGTSWNKVKDDIKYLLDHSDCDGHISPKRCARVAIRILELIKDWPWDYDKENAISLAGGMALAFLLNKRLTFH